jgi:cysteine synthase
VIKAARPDVQIIATEPEVASLLAGKEWKPHKIQGWTPDFLPDVLDPNVHDQLIPVGEEESRTCARRLAAEEGIFVGLSAGATLAAALRIAGGAAAGTTLLVMLPDTGERYLSSWLFEDLEGGSDEAWLQSR